LFNRLVDLIKILHRSTQGCIKNAQLTEMGVNNPIVSLNDANSDFVSEMQTFVIQGVFEMRAQILITSHWLHVELGKNI
jgi:hypothetical protein